MELIVAGLSHHTAPVELRERIAQPPERVPPALDRLVKTLGFAEGLLLSTCNRTELYARSSVSGSDHRALEFLDSLRPAGAPPLEGHVYVRQGDDALRHLFRVASGLDSMVVGEVEIARQMSDAYTLACQAGTAGALLNRAVPRALQIGKRVRTETALARGVSSVAGAVVALGERVFRDLSNCHVVTIGAGETVETALRALRPRTTGRLVICNRTAARAEALALKFNGQPAPLSDLPRRVAEADIVIAATAATEPLLRAAEIVEATRRRERPLMILDLGVPRDVEPAVGRLDNVYLHDVDDLRAITDRSIEQRSQEIPKAEAIVAMAVTEFRRRRQQMEAEPAIKALLDGMLRTRGEVLDHEKNLTPETREAVERATGRLVDRLLRRLAPRMKDGSTNPRQILDAFGIELASADTDEDHEEKA
ncbi:MAG: glutamyl-tRNA reductase [Planctomycetes bacterium]|nr:glutamyl-tRNA reductase [Planctomycetota bacterium]